MRKFKSEKEIYDVVKSFENGTIKRDEWKHAEHLTVALCYVREKNYETAYEKMRDGIFNLLKTFEVDFSKEMPYHETLTIFWLKTVDEFNRDKRNFPFVEACNLLIEKFDKDYPLKFYSREKLFSDEARKMFIEGDLKP